MKKTFANIRTLAAVLMTSAALVACNKEYNATAEQTPQVYTLTIDASMDGGAQTRALEFEGTKLVAKWANDETVDVRFGPTLLGTLTVSNVSADGKTCTLSGTLTGTINKYDVLRFHYNYTSPVNESQTGTLASTAASDYAMAAVTVKSVDGGNITLESEPSFQTQVAVLKITMQDALANKLNATSLKITIGDKDLCTLSPNATAYSENGDGVVYFALPSAHRVYTEGISSIGLDEAELAAATVTFTATAGGNTYITTKTGYPFAAGKYYATTLTMAKPAPTLSLTSPAVGQVIGSDGKNYAASASLPSGVTKVAMIAYVSGANGLAIALADESEKMDLETAKTTAAAHTPAFTGGTWKLPSKDDWTNMFNANGGNEGSYTGLNTAISTAGGTGLKSSDYWTSTEYYFPSMAYRVFIRNNGTVDWNSQMSTEELLVRAVLAF